MKAADRPTVILPGDRIAEITERDVDEQGRTVKDLHRIQYVLDRMFKNKAIDAISKEAGEQFRRDFQSGQLVGYPPRQMEKIDWGRKSNESSSVVFCRERVFRDIAALGGLHTPGARVMWHIIGEEQNMTEFEALHGWKRNSVPGMLVVALPVVAASRKLI